MLAMAEKAANPVWSVGAVGSVTVTVLGVARANRGNN